MLDPRTSAQTESHTTGLPLSDVLQERARLYEGARVRIKPGAETRGPCYGRVKVRAGIHVWLVELAPRFRRNRRDDGIREFTDGQLEVVLASD